MDNWKGTKGEWKCFGIVNHLQHHTYYKVGNSTTEDVRDGESVCNITTRNTERQEANAKLIAAAPELLEACKIAFSICDKLQMPTEFEIEALKVDLKNAIEKALK